MTISATASIQTAHASKYLQQLCKHWEHNLVVEFTADHGTVTFPATPAVPTGRGMRW